MRTTAANVADVTEAHRLLHGEEREAYGDAGYRGVEKRPEQARSEVEWRVALRPALRRLLEPRSAAAQAERAKASLRAKVEHPFLAVKPGRSRAAGTSRGETVPRAREAGPAQRPSGSCWNHSTTSFRSTMWGGTRSGR